jgi:tetratricopeptide (TPR) repeat protein
VEVTIMTLTLCLALLTSAGAFGELADQLEDARRSWEPERVVTVQSRIRSELGDATDDVAVMLRVRAGLAVAEVLRVEYELVEGDRERRRLLGERIDAAAEEALALLDRLPESSERERVRGDLLATMIRSDFRAKKYEPELRTAVERALELDPDNPRAHVTAAKPLLFAPPDRGRDVDAAIEHLDRALELAPGLESARLLRASAREMSGDLDSARADARAALGRNPQCTPAARLLERLGSS